MIVDTFLYNGEVELLNLRLDTLHNVVDMTLVVEGTRTHGNNEPRSFTPERDGLTYIHADLSSYDTAWSRENAQREALWQGIKDLPDDTLILLSDVDEIPTPEAVIAASQIHSPRTFAQRGHYLAIDWLHPDPWLGTVAARKGHISTMNQLRRQRHNYPIYRNSGWHFSWLGGPDAVEEKFTRWCHSELPTDLWNIGNGVHVDGQKMLGTYIDSSYPQWIVDGNAPESWYRRSYAKKAAFTT